ncbi:uncharacterized protein C2845_PM12G02610 [Panicum miliaceum]|uniref:Uncharacterized protein n=1 Tax=Panicum miliaceum TaxID=4540 RepID=A0A3L6QH55_PANMI|nr:uncharacterized protein C2845_PM12G02610 [Panicum miliaceum]
MAAARRLFSFHLALHPREPARPLATAATAVAVPHRRGKHDAVACKATGKTKPKAKAKAANKGGERLRRRPLEEHLKRRTRSAAAFDADLYGRHGHAHHVPVLLGEVLAAFRRPRPLRSFVDCTLGAAGHSLAVRVHPLSCSIAFAAVTLVLLPAAFAGIFVPASCLMECLWGFV